MHAGLSSTPLTFHIHLLPPQARAELIRPPWHIYLDLFRLSTHAPPLITSVQTWALYLCLLNLTGYTLTYVQTWAACPCHPPRWRAKALRASARWGTSWCWPGAWRGTAAGWGWVLSVQTEDLAWLRLSSLRVPEGIAFFVQGHSANISWRPWWERIPSMQRAWDPQPFCKLQRFSLGPGAWQLFIEAQTCDAKILVCGMMLPFGGRMVACPVDDAVVVNDGFLCAGRHLRLHGGYRLPYWPHERRWCPCCIFIRIGL